MKHIVLSLIILASILVGFLIGRIPPTLHRHNIESVMRRMRNPVVFIIDQEPPTTDYLGERTNYNGTVYGRWISDSEQRKKLLDDMKRLITDEF